MCIREDQISERHFDTSMNSLLRSSGCVLSDIGYFDDAPSVIYNAIDTGLQMKAFGRKDAVHSKPPDMHTARHFIRLQHHRTASQLNFSAAFAKSILAAKFAILVAKSSGN